jgi:hypothetical protein
MGNEIGMLSGGYFGVISPEGAASILGRYKDDKEKAQQFPKDCQMLATAQCIYAHQLYELGVVDHIIWESVGSLAGEERESFHRFPRLQGLIRTFFMQSLSRLMPLSPEELIQQRYEKYRKLGKYSLLDDSQRRQGVELAKSLSKKKVVAAAAPRCASGNALKATPLTVHVAEETVLGKQSLFKKLVSASIGLIADRAFSKAAPLLTPSCTVLHLLFVSSCDALHIHFSLP